MRWLFVLSAGFLGCGAAERDTAAADSGCTHAVFHDGDGDGFGGAESLDVECTVVPAGYTESTGDCDDGDAAILPGAAEVCNGVDDDCDGAVDDEPATGARWYPDADADGFGIGDGVVACAQPEGMADAAGDCDDNDAQAFPGGTEVCGGKDEDCDGLVDEPGAENGLSAYADTDGDGAGDAAAGVTVCALESGLVVDASDCDDSDPDRHPGALELCNDRDDDCDGSVDEGAVDARTWFGDADGDGYGDPDLDYTDCRAPDEYVENADDCDDFDPDTNPGVLERCGGGDENCDGAVDESTAVDASFWYADADGDGFGDPTAATAVACAKPAARVENSDDCDDTDAAISPVAVEVCGGGDEDCDGAVDESGATGEATWYPDADADGYGEATGGHLACEGVAGELTVGDDCDDTSAAVSPGEAEDCGTTADDDCSGVSNDACWPTGELTTSDAAFHLSGSAANEGFGRQVEGGADLTGDGVDDLVVAASNPSTGSGRIWVVPGPIAASASSGAASMASVGSGALVTASLSTAGDLDGDGLNDLVTREYGGGLVSIWSGRSTGWSGAADYTQDFGATYDDVLAVDLDGSGTADLVTNSDIDSLALVYDVFGSPQTVTIATSGSVYLAMTVTSADLDGDGIDGLVFGAYYDSKLWVFDPAPTASTTVSAADVILTGSASMGGALTTLDADGDGHDDIVAGADQADPVDLYLLNGPATGWSTGATVSSLASLTIEAPLYSGTAMAAADYDGDGDDDLAVGQHVGTSTWMFFGPLPTGTVNVHTGSEYDTRYTHAATASDSGFLASVGSAVSGYPQGLAIAVMGDDTAATDAGAVYLFTPDY